MGVFSNVLELFKGMAGIEGGSDTERFLKTSTADTLDNDAFGRFRVSMPYDLVDHKNISSDGGDELFSLTTGGATLTWDYQTSSVNYAFTADGTAKRALRQSYYLPYTSGKGHLAVMTGVLDDGNPNSTYSIVRRSSVSGSVVNTPITQDLWNIDTLAGSGQNNLSGNQVRLDKANIFYGDVQWLGVGRIRTAISTPATGDISEAHRFLHAGLFDDVYMRTGSLPIRYELVTDGTTVRARIGYFDDNDGFYFECSKPEVNGTEYRLKEICFSCSSEAAIRPQGVGHHAGTRGNAPTIGTGGGNVLAVRLQNSYNGNANRHLAFLSNAIFSSATQNTYFEILKVYDYTDGGTTWTSVNTNSACEYAAGTNINLTLNGFHVIDSTLLAASSQGSQTRSASQSISTPFTILDLNRFLSQNIDSTQSQLFLVRAFTRTSTSICDAFLTFLEVE